MIGFETMNGPGFTHYSQEELDRIESLRTEKTKKYVEYRPSRPVDRVDLDDIQKQLQKEVVESIEACDKYVPYFMSGKVITGAADESREGLIEFRKKQEEHIRNILIDWGLDENKVYAMKLPQLRKLERKLEEL